jgi:class 3 adenylate cyclase
LKSKIRIARTLGNIGTIYHGKKDFIKALDFHTRALKIYEEIGEKRGIAITLLNIGDVYLNRADYDRAFEYFTRSVKICEEVGEDITLMNAYGETGKLFYLLALDKTGPIVHSPLPVAGDKISYLRKSIEYSLSAFRLGKQIPALVETISWTQLLSDAYRELNDFKMSCYYLDSNRIFKDSVFTIDKEKLINDMSNRREMEVQEKEIQIQNVSLEKANIQRIALAGGLTGLVIILFVIYRSRRKSERVLLNMLPEKIAIRLKNKEKPIADLFSDASVVFIDIVGFTTFSMNKDPGYLITVLTDFFTKMDELSGKHGMEKIKTIGDCYMAVCGLPEPVPDSLERTARFALESRDLMRSYKTVDGFDIRVRIGIDAGKVVAGVIGEKKFSYDLWGDVVNTASRMESHGIVGEIQITENVFHKLDGKFIMKERGEVEIKGKGKMRTWILEGLLSDK